MIIHMHYNNIDSNATSLHIYIISSFSVDIVTFRHFNKLSVYIKDKFAICCSGYDFVHKKKVVVTIFFCDDTDKKKIFGTGNRFSKTIL